MKTLWILTVGIICTAVFVFLISGTSIAGELIFRNFTLFEADNKDYGNFRIPAMVVTPKGTVLAFCEGRRRDSDTGNIDIVLKRSFNNGNTWEPLQVVRDDSSNTCGNPCPVVDRETGTVWLVHTHNPGHEHESQIIKGMGEGTRTVWVLKSTNEGATWSEPLDITEDVKAPNWTWIATGPGVGIQLESRRLVIPCDHTEAKTCYSKANVFYSDDHGTHWKLGGTVRDNFLGEPQVIELNDGTLMLNCRNCDSRLFFLMPFPTIDHTTNYRTVAVSNNGGLSWSRAWQDSVLIEPGMHGCQASILRYTDKKHHGKNRVLFSNPASKKTREKMTVRLSYDEGRTWAFSKQVTPHLAGYSCLAVLKNGMIACFYEGGTERYNDTISLALFNLEWLTDGTDYLQK